MATVLLRNLHVVITSWYWYILDTITGGNFLGVSALEAMNAIESLVGAPPINYTKTKITLEDIMERFDTLENNIPSIFQTLPTSLFEGQDFGLRCLNRRQRTRHEDKIK